MAIFRHKIDVTGTVQGIGFRPFIYREALSLNLTGHVYNHSSGVTIEAEGTLENIKKLIQRIRQDHPPFAEIHSIKETEIRATGGKEFKILESVLTGSKNTLVSPDIATCDDCLSDIFSPSNRRHRYSFTNCTNCGPRYTIIEDLPYDRPFTSMKDFVMCPECAAEYVNPMDRRYHAQPNCCSKCGPTLMLLDSKGVTIKTGDAITEAIKLLHDGAIVAIKGIGGFHLTCNAADEAAVKRLRERKRRDEKPFAVMMPDAETVRQFCTISPAEEALLTSPQRPIVLLHKSNGKGVTESVAPGNSYLGVMLPYTPLHHLLFANVHISALIMTSANISDEPICYRNDESFERLKGIADYFLTHNRDIFIRTDDSITRVINDKPLMLRRARGYAPHPIVLDEQWERSTDSVLAVGAELKNSICLLKGNKAFLGQHIGDLQNTAAFNSFEQSISHLEKIFEIRPAVIAHDMHPDYFNSHWAMKKAGLDMELVPVQHHHAHIASCMAENRLTDPVIGVALDGTGLGTDGAIWGGEILIADYLGFERVGHLEYLPLPGGDAAAKNPRQMAISYLRAAGFNSTAGIKEVVPSLRTIPDDNIDLVLKMLDKNINSPLTSSAGRLFDAVSAIIGLRQTNTFEGQAALELEMCASRGPKVELEYLYNLKNSEYITIDYIETIKAILNDIKDGVSTPEISIKFHNTVARSISLAVLDASKKTGISLVALSGGCFQNVILTTKLKNLLDGSGLTVYTHSIVPPNDGGIALGQAVIALNKVGENICA